MRAALSSISTPLPFAFLKQSGDEGVDAARVVVEVRAEGLAQESLFGADAYERAECVDEDGEGEREPVADGERGRQEHAEHACVDGVADDAVGAARREPVPLHDARRQAPLPAALSRGGDD